VGARRAPRAPGPLVASPRTAPVPGGGRNRGAYGTDGRGRHLYGRWRHGQRRSLRRTGLDEPVLPGRPGNGPAGHRALGGTGPGQRRRPLGRARPRGTALGHPPGADRRGVTRLVRRRRRTTAAQRGTLCLGTGLRQTDRPAAAGRGARLPAPSERWWRRRDVHAVPLPPPGPGRRPAVAGLAAAEPAAPPMARRPPLGGPRRPRTDLLPAVAAGRRRPRDPPAAVGPHGHARLAARTPRAGLGHTRGGGDDDGRAAHRGGRQPRRRHATRPG
jgi:hypothetical protein